jgi:hypothetical protein
MLLGKSQKPRQSAHFGDPAARFAQPSICGFYVTRFNKKRVGAEKPGFTLSF